MEHIALNLSDGSWWWFGLAVILLAAISTIAYWRTSPETSVATKAVFIVLRTSGMALLLLALFGPLLYTISSLVSKPKVSVAVDVSSSMKASDRSGDRRAQTLKALRTVQEMLGANAVFFTFGEGARQDDELLADSMKFDGERTNISNVLQTISNSADATSTRCALVISDGNHNTGESPLYTADNVNMPVFTIGIGDTVAPRDVSIDAMVVPNLGFVDQPLSISVDASWNSIPEGQLEVTLYDNGQEVGREPLFVRDRFNHQTVTFSFIPKQPGVRKYSAQVRAVDGEYTQKNNRIEQFVEIRSNKRTVLLFAGSPSSDVSFIRGILSANPALTVKTFIQKQGAEFYETAPSAMMISQAELCVFVGFPIASTPQSLLEQIGRECSKGLPLLFVAGLSTDYTKLKPFASVLPFAVSASRPNEFQITADVPASSVTNPLLRLLGSESDVATWNNLPPVYRTETFVTPANGAKVLATIRVNNTPLDDPLFLSAETGVAKCFAILAHGIYRWKLLADAPNQARGLETNHVLDRLVLNSIQWLGVKNSDKRVVIKPTHRFYSASEQVRFTAAVSDAALKPAENATVKVAITGGGKQFEFVIAPQGNGRYYSNLGSLPPADYTYTGTATLDGNSLGTDNGRFSVTDASVEDAATWCNVGLLTELSKRSGGSYAHYTNTQDVVKAMLEHPALRDIVETKEKEQLLWHLPWMLMAAVTCFGVEWYLRKRRGLL